LLELAAFLVGARIKLGVGKRKRPISGNRGQYRALVGIEGNHSAAVNDQRPIGIGGAHGRSQHLAGRGKPGTLRIERGDGNGNGFTGCVRTGSKVFRKLKPAVRVRGLDAGVEFRVDSGDSLQRKAIPATQQDGNHLHRQEFLDTFCQGGDHRGHVQMTVERLRAVQQQVGATAKLLYWDTLGR